MSVFTYISIFCDTYEFSVVGVFGTIFYSKMKVAPIAAKLGAFSSLQHQENGADQFQYHTYLERVRYISFYFFQIIYDRFQ